jgi:hypothetical protein
MGRFLGDDLRSTRGAMIRLTVLLRMVDVTNFGSCHLGAFSALNNREKLCGRRLTLKAKF